MSGTFTPTAETTPTRHRDRASYEREAAYAVIDEATLCHVGFVADGRPVVLPQLHARVGDMLYLHGSSGARALAAARGDGLDVCVTVTLLDGLVLARSAFNHSANYRSVVVLGRATVVADTDEKQSALASLVDAVVPGRSDHVRGPSRKELAATTVLRLPLETASLKTRSGPPADDQEDLGLPYWAGVIPLTPQSPLAPQSSPDLAGAIDVPEHVTAWGR